LDEPETPAKKPKTTAKSKTKKPIKKKDDDDMDEEEDPYTALSKSPGKNSSERPKNGDRIPCAKCDDVFSVVSRSLLSLRYAT